MGVRRPRALHVGVQPLAAHRAPDEPSQQVRPLGLGIARLVAVVGGQRPLRSFPRLGAYDGGRRLCGQRDLLLNWSRHRRLFARHALPAPRHGLAFVCRIGHHWPRRIAGVVRGDQAADHGARSSPVAPRLNPTRYRAPTGLAPRRSRPQRFGGPPSASGSTPGGSRPHGTTSDLQSPRGADLGHVVAHAMLLQRRGLVLGVRLDADELQVLVCHALSVPRLEPSRQMTSPDVSPQARTSPVTTSHSQPIGAAPTCRVTGCCRLVPRWGPPTRRRSPARPPRPCPSPRG
jgi:hypothetical protein